MGYRVPYESIDPSGNKAACILDLNGTKYLILVIDDYNQNHVNNSLVSISQYSNTLKMPTLMLSDGTNKLWKIRQWEKESQELNLRFLSTSLIGSVTINCHH
jgi:hypothetical protein